MTSMTARMFLLLALLVPVAAMADEPKPDDIISVNLSTEGWVQASAARVMVAVNAAVVGEKAGSTRDAMIKAVQLFSPKADWRLTSFNRSQDPTGLEQWYAVFEARLPESDLGGIHEKAKAASKAGMQLSIQSIDFTPTLTEVEAVRGTMRKTLMAMATKEMEAVNAAYPTRQFRIAQISFGGAQPVMQPQMMMLKRGMAMASDAAPEAMMASVNGGGAIETSQKIDMNAMVTFAALAPVVGNK
jgi:hypothetical protein